MEKKNTILLTVIAVATLLVAVVGATFAYYSLNVTAADGTVKVGASADDLGTIALTSGKGNFSLTLSPADMAEFGAVKDYYANASGIPTESQQKNEIANVAFTKAGAKNTKYSCTSKVVVTLENGAGTMGNVLKTGDAAFVLTPGSENVLIEDSNSPVSLDLSTLKVENTEEYTVKYTLDDVTNASKPERLLADLKLTNRTDEEQNYLVGENGLTLKVTVQTTEFNCEIAEIN